MFRLKYESILLGKPEILLLDWISYFVSQFVLNLYLQNICSVIAGNDLFKVVPSSWGEFQIFLHHSICFYSLIIFFWYCFVFHASRHLRWVVIPSSPSLWSSKCWGLEMATRYSLSCFLCDVLASNLSTLCSLLTSKGMDGLHLILLAYTFIC